MKFRFFNILWSFGVSGLLLLSNPAVAQDDEALSRQLVAGEAALRDGFYALADQKILSFIEETKNKEQQVKGVLLLAESLHAQKRYEDVVTLLNRYRELAEIKGASGFTYWKAKTLFDSNQLAEARALLDIAVPKSDDPLYGSLMRLKARAMLLDGKEEEALLLFAKLDKQLSGNAETPLLLLDWALALIQQEQFNAATELLERLRKDSAPSLESSEAGYWLARIKVEQRQELEAIELLAGVVKADELTSATRVEAWTNLAALYDARGGETNMVRAVEALTEAEKLIGDEKAVARNRVAQAVLRIKAGQRKEGADLLRAQASVLGEEKLVSDAFLYLGRTQLNAQAYVEAGTTFQEYLEFFSEGKGLAEAHMGKAWSLYYQEAYGEAVTEFEKAYAQLSDDKQRREAFFKIADAQFEGEKYTEAREKYMAYTRRYAGDERLPQALFQAAMCLFEQGSLDIAEREFQRIQFIYRKDPFAERSLLQSASIHARRHDWEKAIKVYESYLAEYPENSFAPSALLSKGLAQYRHGLFSDARESFRALTKAYPTSEFAQRAWYMQGWALYLEGDEAAALNAFEEFVGKFPDSKWCEHVLFRMAEISYGHGDYLEAQTRFEELLEKFPEGELTEKGFFWAGRAAFQRSEFPRALELFKGQVEKFPESSRVADALFWQGDTLVRQGQFDAAILVFEEIIKNHNTTYLLYPAWSKKGDCLINLGNKEKDPTRFQGAMAAFQTIMDGAEASLAMKLDAEYKVGDTEEKKLERKDKALEHYLNVTFQYMANRDKLGASNEHLLTRAVLRAGELLEEEGEYREAIAIYRKLKIAGAHAAPEAEKRINKIKRENLLFFE